MYPESDLENIVYRKLFTVKRSFCILGTTRVQKSTMSQVVCGVHKGRIWPTD